MVTQSLAKFQSLAIIMIVLCSLSVVSGASVL